MGYNFYQDFFNKNFKRQSDKGLLYYSDNMENINKKESLKLWEYLHENRAKLTCFQVNLFDVDEVVEDTKDNVHKTISK